jgi:hypothetical protein
MVGFSAARFIEEKSSMKKVRLNNKGFTPDRVPCCRAIVGMIGAIAVPGLLRVRMSGNEAWAIGVDANGQRRQGDLRVGCSGAPEAFYSNSWEAGRPSAIRSSRPHPSRTARRATPVH